jgi:hypothetical protein
MRARKLACELVAAFGKRRRGGWTVLKDGQLTRAKAKRRLGGLTLLACR